MMSDSDSPAILSYHNTLLLRSDLDLLSAGEWLNDRLIGFAFEYLEFQVLPSASSACSGQASPDLASRILLVGPDVAFLLANMDPDQAAGILASLDAPSRELVLLPVNNNRNVEAAGGSHWSLLVVDCSSQRLFHIDSAEGSNMSSAKSLARILRSVLGISAKVPVRAMPCPQQNNSYDCGMHTIRAAECICQQACLLDAGTPLSDIFDSPTFNTALAEMCGPKAVSAARLSTKSLIQSLSQQYPPSQGN